MTEQKQHMWNNNFQTALVIYHWVTTYPKSSQLKTTHIYYVTVFVVQEFMHGLTIMKLLQITTIKNDPLTQILSQGCNWGVGQRRDLIRMLDWEEFTSHLTHVAGISSFGQFNWGLLLLSGRWPEAYHVGLFKMVACFIKASKRESLLAKWKSWSSVIFYNQRSDILSHLPYPIC